MSKKLHISVPCGGKSTEHEISIQSARNVVAALDPDKYVITVVFIDHNGKWYLIERMEDFLNREPGDLVRVGQAEPITVSFGDPKHPWRSLNEEKRQYTVDCFFPMVHGTQGEDGALQGLFELLNLPYVGADVQSSAVCMEKDITKSLLKAAKVPVVDWLTVWPSDSVEGMYERLVDRWGTPELFVKAASLGSSVGTLPVKTESEFNAAIATVFRYDDRLIVEPWVRGREIECAVLGNGNPKAALPSEIVLHHDYYSYEAKYIDSNGATTIISAKLPESLIKRIQQIAIDAFKAVHCSGMARVDFFITNNDEVLVNEINTIPGFTNTSLYPKMWEASGLPCRKLLDQLIELALERYQDQQKLIRRYEVK